MGAVSSIKNYEKLNELKKKLNPRDRLLVVFGLNSGLRISDLLKLTVGDVYDENGKPRKELRVKEQKTKKLKNFPFNAPIMKELRAYAKKTNIRELDPDDPLFISRKLDKNGKRRPITRNRAHAIIKEAAEAVGITSNIGTHSLRKTWAMNLYKNGYPLAQISKALNHSSEAVTLRYLGFDKEEMDRMYLENEL